MGVKRKNIANQKQYSFIACEIDYCASISMVLFYNNNQAASPGMKEKASSLFSLDLKAFLFYENASSDPGY